MTAATIGVLSPGEMGSQVGRVLLESGARVLTCVEGRSEATRRRAQEAGFEPLPSLGDVVRRADLVLCVVPPRAALPVAKMVAEALRVVSADGESTPSLTLPRPRGRGQALTPSPLHRRWKGGAGERWVGGQPSARPAVRPADFLYCDANSIGPATARQVEQIITEAGGEFVDGAIIGGANGLRDRTTVYLSGREADRVAGLLAPLRTSVIGSEAGRASAFKVLYAGLTKGLSALGVELLAGAERLGLSDLLMEKYRTDQTGVARFFEQTLPGLPPRAARRAEEMIELADTLEGLGLTAHMARAAQTTLAAVAEQHRASELVGDDGATPSPPPSPRGRGAKGPDAHR